jgi:monoterpene epsilon-lactone hydrolase
VCLSPWVDLTQSAPSYRRVGERDPMVSKEALDVLADAYLSGADPRDALASPLFAPDLSGLPPLHIEVGELEVLADDATRLAEAARAAGVETALTEWPGMIHVFQAFPGEVLPESDESVAAIGRFLSSHLGSGHRPAPTEQGVPS